jgi:hypothetical protein
MKQIEKYKKQKQIISMKGKADPLKHKNVRKTKKK